MHNVSFDRVRKKISKGSSKTFAVVYGSEKSDVIFSLSFIWNLACVVINESKFDIGTTVLDWKSVNPIYYWGHFQIISIIKSFSYEKIMP